MDCLKTTDIIAVWQTLVLLATLLFMYYQFHKTTNLLNKQLYNMSSQVEIMNKELDQIKKAEFSSIHQDIYNKLFCIYFRFIDNADDLKDIFRAYADKNSKDVKEEYMMFALFDIIYLMYLQRDELDSGLKTTWMRWINKIFIEPKLYEFFNEVKDEYDEIFIKFIESFSPGRR